MMTDSLVTSARNHSATWDYMDAQRKLDALYLEETGIVVDWTNQEQARQFVTWRRAYFVRITQTA